jgi:hypothetical protein
VGTPKRFGAEHRAGPARPVGIGFDEESC